MLVNFSFGGNVRKEEVNAWVFGEEEVGWGLDMKRGERDCAAFSIAKGSPEQHTRIYVVNFGSSCLCCSSYVHRGFYTRWKSLFLVLECLQGLAPLA